MANVGYATLTVSPSMRGAQQSMQRQLGGIMPAAGRRAGQQLGQAIGGSATAALLPNLRRASSMAAGEVARASGALTKARTAEVASAARVTAAEQRLATVQGRAKVNADQLATAQGRVATAKAQHQLATERVAGAQRQMTAAEQGAAQASRQLATAVAQTTRSMTDQSSQVTRATGPWGRLRAGASSALGSIRSGVAGIGGAIASGVTNPTNTATGAMGDLRSSIRGMAQMGAIFAAGLGFVNLGRSIYEVSTGAQHTEAVLEGLYETAGHGADEAQRMMGLLNDRFSRSGIAMQAFQQGASDLAYLGLTAHETANLMQFMESTISATGGSAEELGRVTTALASAQNAGRASAAELNQISQAGVPIYDMLADHLGITNAEIRDLTGSGTLLVEDVLEAMQAQGGTWASGLVDGAERANRTWSSAWDSMRNTFINGIASQLMPLLDRVSPAVHRMADGVGAAFEALPGLMSRAGQAMRDAGVTDAIRSIATGILELARGAGPALTGFALGAGAALAGLVLALGPVGDMLGQVGEWMQANQGVVQIFGIVVGALAAAWFTVVKPILAVVAAFKAGGAAIALLSNPIGWIITAIALLAAGFAYAWKNSEQFRNIVTGAWEWIQTAAAAAVDWFMGTAWPALQEFWASIVEGASGTGAMWADSWESIQSIFRGVWTEIQAIWNQYGEGILSAIRTWIQILISFWSGVWTALPGVVSGAWTIISGLISGALSIIKGIINFFVGLLTGDWQRMWDGWISIGEGLWTAIVAIFEGLVQAIGGILKGLWEIIKGVWEAIYNWLVGNSIVPDLVEAIVDWFQKLSDWIGNVLSAMWGIIRGIWNSIVSGITSFVSGIVKNIQTAWNLARSITTSVFQAVWSFIQGVWNNIRSTVSGAVNTVRTAISTAWNTVRTLTTSAWQAIVSAVTTRLSNLLSRVRQIPSQVRSALSNIGSMMRTVGTNIITGIINGVTGAAGRLFSSLRNMARNALNAAKNALGISSPSRVFRDEVGGEIVAGLLGGINAGQGLVDQALSDLVSARPALGGVRVPVSAEVSRHAAAQQQRALTHQKDLVRAEVRNEQAMRDLTAAIRAQGDGDVVVQVDSKEIARANRKGEHGLARR